LGRGAGRGGWPGGRARGHVWGASAPPCGGARGARGTRPFSHGRGADRCEKPFLGGAQHKVAAVRAAAQTTTDAEPRRRTPVGERPRRAAVLRPAPTVRPLSRTMASRALRTLAGGLLTPSIPEPSPSTCTRLRLHCLEGRYSPDSAIAAASILEKWPIASGARSYGAGQGAGKRVRRASPRQLPVARVTQLYDAYKSNQKTDRASSWLSNGLEALNWPCQGAVREAPCLYEETWGGKWH
jgi:hypothetical protein